MGYFVICLTAFFVSALSFLSGFGLGTVLMPVLALFFPLPLAISATAVVHLAANIFKIVLVGKFAKFSVVLSFGIPAAIFSAVGAYVLGVSGGLPLLTSFHINGIMCQVTVLGVIVGMTVIASSAVEFFPKTTLVQFHQKYIPVGGAVSGFLGGLSGNQGILRTAFLIHAGLGKEQFIGTGALCSAVVDCVRVLVYGWAIATQHFEALPHEMYGLVGASALAALAGAYMGSRLMTVITLSALRIIVGVMLVALGLVIGLGVV